MRFGALGETVRRGSVWQLDGLPSVPTQNMADEKWHELRRSGVGGSDIAAILGLSPWRTPLGVYCEKRALVPQQESNEAMLFGTKMEPVLRDWARESIEQKFGKPVRVYSSPYLYRHSSYEFIIANIDGVVTQGDGADEIAYAGLELKTADRTKMREWEEGVPDYYEAQVQHYMGITGLAAWYVFALIGKAQRLYIIAADEKKIAEQVSAAKKFWIENVQGAKMPGVTGDDTDTLLKLFPDATDMMIRDDSFEQIVKQYVSLGAEVKAIEASKDKCKAEIEAKLGSSIALMAGKYKVTWSRFEVSRLDGKKLKEKYPEATAQCSYTTKQGRLMVKEGV